MNAFVVVVATIYGLLLGSFANVVVYRVPLDLSVVRPRSACPTCGRSITAKDNIPVVSWILLGGRCRYCNARINARYPALEAAMAAVFGITAATATNHADLILTLPLAFSFVCLAVIDIETKRLPDKLTYPTFFIGVLLAVAASIVLGDSTPLWNALRSAGGALVVFFLIALAAPGGFGLGDVKLAPSLGLAMGFATRGGARSFVGFMAAFVLGALIGILLMAGGKAGRKTKIPFGPFLVAGTFLVLWTGDAFVRPWLGG